MDNLSLDEIASRIADKVLETRIVSKKELTEKIRPLLKIWLKKADTTKKYRKKTPEAVLQYTIELEKSTSRFWLEVAREKIGLNNMKPFYDKQ